MKKEFVKKLTRTMLVVLVSLVSLWGLVNFDPENCNGGNGVKKPFVLAYFDQNWKLQIRYSENGTSWESASVGHTEIDRSPGLTCDDNAVMYLSVFGRADSKACYNMGLGCATWDNSSTIIGDGHTGLIRSGTSLIHLDGTKYIASFLTTSQVKFYIFNTSNSSRDFEDDVTPVVGVVNNSTIQERPAITRMDQKILAGWVFEPVGLQLVNGKIEAGAPVWDPGYQLNIPETGFYSPESVIDLATDGEKFYLATLRKGEPDGSSLYPFSVFIYTSTNGLNWTKLTSFSTNYVKISALSIAASSSSNVLAVISSGASSLSFTKVKRFNGSSWSEISSSQVFGSNTNMHGYDLTLFKSY